MRNIIRFFKEVFQKTGIVITIAFIIGFGINYIPGVGWVNFLAKALLYSILFSSLMFLFGMRDSEKNLFMQPINKILKK